MKNSKILVTASTGNIGTPLSRALHKKQVPFTAATRDPEKAMEKLGFETDTVDLDFKDPWSESNYTQGICERDAGILFLSLLQQTQLNFRV
ncbi:MAG: hypothetical protein K9J30_15345 [Bacteroidales bacterium]|nr:hypothetical protein [Bacteroidales bacterium]